MAMMSTKSKVLITRSIPAAALAIIQSRCEVEQWESDDAIPNEILHEKARGKDGIFCLLTDRIDANLLQHAGDQLKVVSTMSVGVDHVDLEGCRERAIKVGYTPGILTSATAELTVGLLLATSRRIVEGTRAVKSGEWGSWKGAWMCGPGLDGSTVGFFGLGRIGQAVLQRLRPFDVTKFVFSSQTRKSAEFERDVGAQYVTFDELLRESDFVICCCALTPSTRHIFDRDAFLAMKSSAVFVNISRGGVVKQEDLYEALRSKQIAAAGLDVTDPEPLPTDDRLLSLENCVVTPHIGSATYRTREEMAVLAANNLVNGLSGQPMPAPYAFS